MDEVAAAMGTSKSIVYRYFTDKAGLAEAVGEVVLDEIADALAEASRAEGTAQQRMRAMIEVYVSMLAHSPNVYRFVTGVPAGASMSGFVAAVSESVAAPLAEIIGDADPEGRLARLWATGMVGFVRSTCEVWLQTPVTERLDAQALVDMLAGWLWRGASATSRIRSTGASS